MKTLMTIAVIVSCLLWNISYANSEHKITCKTGFFSTKSFIVKRMSYLKNNHTFCEPYTDEDGMAVLCFGQDTADEIKRSDYNYVHLLSDSRKKLSTTIYYPNRYNEPFQFEWHEGDLGYALSDSAKGWSIKIMEKDWSSSEGNHYDTFLDRTYCQDVN